MKPSELRRHIADRPREDKEVQQSIKVYSDVKNTRISVVFSYPTDHIMFTGSQIPQTIDALLKAAREAGVQYEGAIKRGPLPAAATASSSDTPQ